MKKYKIDSLADICNAVTPENVANFKEDFSSWLDIYLMNVQAMRLSWPKETQGKTNTELVDGKMTWIDDGKHNITGTIKSENFEVRFKS